MYGAENPKTWFLPISSVLNSVLIVSLIFVISTLTKCFLQSKIVAGIMTQDLIL